MSLEASETTQLLLDWGNGSPTALDDLTPRIYKELRRIAAVLTKRERNGHTLDARRVCPQPVSELETGRLHLDAPFSCTEVVPETSALLPVWSQS